MIIVLIKKTVPPHKKSLLCVRLWWNLHTYWKIGNKMGNCHERFFHFIHRKRVIHWKREKRRSAVMYRTVERFNLHSWNLYQLKPNFAHYKTTESFFFEFHCLKNLNCWQRNFFQISKNEIKKTLCKFIDHKITLLLIPNSDLKLKKCESLVLQKL